MSRYYFDVREGARFTPDDVGLEFDGLDAAENEAICAAAEIARDRLPKGHAREVSVEVKNARGQRVLTVTVSLGIDRVQPPLDFPPPANRLNRRPSEAIEACL